MCQAPDQASGCSREQDGHRLSTRTSETETENESISNYATGCVVTKAA